MDKYQEALLVSIDTLINEKLKNIPYDYTFSAIIKTDNGSGNYTITYNGQDYNVNARAGLTLTVGDVVYVRCIQGNFSEKSIDCKRL